MAIKTKSRRRNSRTLVMVLIKLLFITELYELWEQL